MTTLTADDLGPCHEARIDARTPHVIVAVDELREFAERHGANLDDVESITYEAAGPSVAFTVYRVNAEGYRFVELLVDGEWQPASPQGWLGDLEHRVAVDVVEAPLVGELPAWWQPAGAGR